MRYFFLALLASLTTASASEMAMQSRLATHTLVLDYADLGGRLIAVGEFGNVVYTDDAGRNWTQAKSVPTRVTLTDVAFVNAQLGFAVGHDATILKTTDSGETWEVIYQDSAAESPLFGIYFANAQRGFAVGAFGTILRTRNGGATWESDLIDSTGETDYHLNAIVADKNGALYVVAESGVVYKSLDGGRNFRAQRTGYDGSFWNGMVLKSGRLLIWGMRGNVYYSDTGGQTWRKSRSSTDRSVMGGTQLENGKIVLTGLSGLVLTSTNNGVSFTETVRKDRRSYAAISRGADGRAILYGDSGIVWQDIP